MDKRATAVLAYVIIVSWAISFLVDIIVRDYDPPATVHALMMMVAGSVFVKSVYTKSSDEEEP